MRAMLDRRHNLAASRGIGTDLVADLVADPGVWSDSPASAKDALATPRCLGVSPGLDGLIEDLAILIDGAHSLCFFPAMANRVVDMLDVRPARPRR